MRFLYPAFLAGAVAIAIPIVLHFLRRDIAPEVPFSAVRLLRRSPVARARRRRLRDLLLLAARVGALLLLAFAFARPYLAGADASSSLRIVAIDRSFSMGAPGRFARALALANQAIDEAARGERVALVVFDHRADLVAGPGAPGAARAALSGLAPGQGGTEYAAVLAKAAEIAGLDPTRLVIVTDLHQAGWNGEVHAVVPANVTVDVRDAGGPASNVAVTAVRVTADGVMATIRNEAATAWKGDVRVVRDGRIAATTAAMVSARSSAEASVAYRSPGSGALEVAIDDPAGFPADNARYVVTEAAARGSVLVITSGTSQSGYYVARAMAAAQETDTRLISAAALSAAEVAKHSAIVLLSTRGMERRARDAIVEVVRAGGGLLIAAASDVDPIVLSTSFSWKPALSAAEQAPRDVVLSATDVRHPILRPFGALSANFGQVHFDRTWRVRDGGWDTTARFSDGGPALLERREGNGRVVLFASDLDRRWNDFPLHPAYVPFVLEAVRYIMPARDRGRDYLVTSVPAGAESRPGVYRAAADNRLVAVNVDPRESAVSSVSPAQFAAMIDAVQPAGGGGVDVRARHVEARQAYWQYGLLLMLAALVAESFIGRT